MLNRYGELLLSGEAKLGIWGIGYLGYSDLTRYVMNGIRCVVSDYSPKRLERMRSEFLPADMIKAYLEMQPENLDINDYIEIRMRYQDLLEPDIPIHLLSVPTQDQTRPTNKWIMQALEAFVGIKNVPYQLPPLLIIESSLIPGTMDKVILPFFEDSGLTPGRDLLIGLCSIRDWFDESGKTTYFPRIVSGIPESATDLTAEIVEFAGASVIRSPDYRIVELIKSVENSFNQVHGTIANQLALAFPGMNIREAMRLAAVRSHARGILPNFGSGGYETPLACQYVMEGAEISEYLTIFRESIYADQAMPKMIADIILRKDIQHLHILGVSCQANVRISAMSPGLRIIEHLKGKIAALTCHDPFYQDSELKEMTGLQTFLFPDGLQSAEAILITAGHDIFKRIAWDKLKKSLSSCRLILDSTGVWKNFPWDETGIGYFTPGDAGWSK